MSGENWSQLSYDFGDLTSKNSSKHLDEKNGASRNDPQSSEIVFPKGSGSGSTIQNQTQSFLYIVMQLCKTETLKDWLKDNTDLDHLSRRVKAFEIIQQICDGVSYIHQQGLIHRFLINLKFYWKLPPPQTNKKKIINGALHQSIPYTEILELFHVKIFFTDEPVGIVYNVLYLQSSSFY